MFAINTVKAKYLEWEIRDEENNSSIKVIPEKGGIITSFKVKGKELLYLDEERFYRINDITTGGIPVLFPICGDLKDGKYMANGVEYNMDSHGFAWNMEWEVKEIGSGDKGYITIGLKSGYLTKLYYPYTFEVFYKYSLENDSLFIHQEYINNGSEEMKFYSGFHPFFSVSDKKTMKLRIPASHYFDNNDGEVKIYEGCIDFDNAVDFVFDLEKSDEKINFTHGEHGVKTVSMELSGHYKSLVVWTLPDKDFVCVEPWMAPPDAMNTGNGLYSLLPGQSVRTWIRIKADIGVE